MQSQQNKIKPLRRSIIDMIKVKRGGHLDQALSFVDKYGTQESLFKYLKINKDNLIYAMKKLLKGN